LEHQVGAVHKKRCRLSPSRVGPLMDIQVDIFLAIDAKKQFGLKLPVKLLQYGHGQEIRL
jgi:hypothetical protein